MTRIDSIADFVGSVLDSSHRFGTCRRNHFVDFAENPDLCSSKNCHVSRGRVDLTSSMGPFGNIGHMHLRSKEAVGLVAYSNLVVVLTSEPDSQVGTSMVKLEST